MRKKILLIFFAIFFLGAISSFGQKYEILGSSPGTTIACPAGHENMHSRVGTPGQDGFMAQRKATSTTPPTSEIQLIFRGGDAGDPDFRRACRHAADIWERYIVSSVPIVIDIGFENLGRNTLARAGPTINFILTDDAYPDGRIFPVALANALLERDLAPNEPDIRVTVNSHWSIFYLLDYDTDGDPGFFQYDLVTIMLHEIGHGLGFSTFHNVDQNSGLGSRSRPPYRYDDFLENGPGTGVMDIPTPSNTLANFYTSNNLFINGPNTVYRFGGNRPRIYSPSLYKGGSSISHWDEGSFPAGNPNSLMTPQTGLNEAIHKPGTITLGLFADLGWTIHENGSFTADGIRFQITSSNPKTVMAVDYIGTASVVTIPGKVGGHTVNAIGNSAFKGNGLTRVTIPGGVTSIGQDAFRDNRLESVVIPNNVTTIGTFAFRENQLSSITLGTNVTAIGYGAFKFNQLTNVVIPNGVANIGGEAFTSNPITKVTAQGVGIVPTIVTAHTFSNRHEIDLIVPGGKIQIYLDNGWTDFKTISEPAEVGRTFIADHITYKITSLAPNPNTVMATGYNTAGGDIVTIPPTVDYGPNTYTVTSIREYAFWTKDLTRVTIPGSVTSIGQDAFQNNNLTEVTFITPSNITRIGDGVFKNNQLTGITIPNGVTSIGNSAFSINELTEVTLPGNVTSIDAWAFDRNPGLNTVFVKAGVPPSLAANAFPYRHQIDLVVPIGTLGSYQDNTQWEGFNSITEVAVIGGTFIAENITYKINSIISNTVTATGYTITGGRVTIPPTVVHGPTTYAVTAIGNKAFKEKQLAEVTFITPGNVTSIGDNAFQGNELTHVDIPDNVTHIGMGAFVVNKLESVVIPNSVTRIENAVFSHNQLTEVTIPSGVTGIRNHAFANNPGLSTVVLAGSTPPTLAADAFTNRATVDVVVPRGAFHNYVPAWGSFNFRSITEEVANGDTFTDYGITYEVTDLGSPNTVTITDNINTIDLTIPGTVTYGGNNFDVTGIGDSAFKDNNLTRVVIPNTITSIRQDAFKDNPHLATVVSKGAFPPSIEENTFTNAGRSQIAVFVPKGSPAGSIKTAYKDAGWTGFKSITEGIPVSINAPAQVDNLTPFLVTISFSQNVTGFTQEDINVVNATLVDGSFPLVDGPTSTYTLEMTPTTCEDTITVEVPGNVAEHTGGFPNLPASTTVTVNALPVAPSLSSSSVEYCVNETAHPLTATGTDLLWYTTPTGGTPIEPIPNTENAGETSYYVSQTNTNGCESKRTGIVVTVNALPVAPAVNSQSVEFCVNETAHPLTATGTDLLWYTTPTGGTPTEPIPNTENAGKTSWYVGRTNTNGCESKRTGIVVTVNALPVAPAVNSPSVEFCVNETAHPLTATGTDLLWYTTPTGGTPIEPIPNTENAGETSWYVSQTNTNGCESKRTEIVVTVNDLPATPAVNSPSVEFCVNETAHALTATGTDLLWYTTPAGGTPIEPIPNTENAGETSWYVSQTNTNGCESKRKGVVVTVNDLPVAPAVNSSSVEFCVNETAHPLTATGTDLLWYTTPTGGTPTEPIPNTENAGETSWYVGQTNTNGCESKRTGVVVTVNDLPVAPAVNSQSAEYCVNETAHALTAIGTNLLWYTTPTGGTPIEPIPNTENAGETSYYVSQTNTNGCESKRTGIVVTVNDLPVAPAVSSPVEYCVDELADALTATGNNLLWYTTGAEETGTSTAPIPNTVNVGSTTHYVSQTTNGCEGERAMIVVTVETCPAQIGDRFTVSGIDYEITSISPYTVAVRGRSSATPSPAAITIPGTVTYESITYTVTAIGANAFNDNPNLDLATLEATPPPSIHENALTGRGQVDLVVPAGTREDYLKEGWTGFRSITYGIFTDKEIKYGITSINPNEVKVMDYIGSATAVEIPETVTYEGITYTVTAIGANAFSDNPGLDLVILGATHPPSIHENALTGRGQVDLVVPIGMRQAYLENGWTGFASITEEQVVTAIHNHELNDFALYPNPARDKVYIDIDPRPGQELKQVNIYTMIGAYLYSENGPVINTARLPRGTYLFEIVTKTGDRSMRRVIIQ